MLGPWGAGIRDQGMGIGDRGTRMDVNGRVMLKAMAGGDARRLGLRRHRSGKPSRERGSRMSVMRVVAWERVPTAVEWQTGRGSCTTPA